MNNSLRDPFNLRRNLLDPTNRGPGAANALTQLNLLRATASQVATQVTERVAETAAEALERGKQAVEDLNQNLRDQRERGKEKKDDDYNYNQPHDGQGEGRSKDDEDMSFTVPKNVPSFTNPQRAIEDRLWSSSGFGDFLNPNRAALPMYKDKPFAYPPSSRSRPFYRRKRYMAWFLFLVLGVAYWLGMFGKDGYERMPSFKSTSWLKSDESSTGDKVDWLERRERVVEAFTLSWDSYARYGWGHDVYHPVTKAGQQMAKKGLGWIIVDALDTMMLMNLTSRVAHAREWIATSLSYDQDQDVNTFETTIRMLGGLLSAHYLSNTYPDLAPQSDDDPGAPGEDLYLEKAKDLADRLLAAFDSESGIPYASVNLGKYQGIASHSDGGASSTAEATTLQLEFKYLAKLTGEKNFWDKVEKVMQVLDDNGAKDGLVPIYISADSGKFRGQNIRLGSRGDSYYEYLIKQYLQTNNQEPIYLDMWEEALRGTRKHLVSYTEHAQFTIIGEKVNGLGGELSPKMDHLVCFMPGTIALAATGGISEAEAKKLPTWTAQKERDMQLARELTHTCWGMYKYMATGLAAEITFFKLPYPELPEGAKHQAPATFDPDPEAEWRKDFIVKGGDSHNLQRPETVESLFYMWRITGDIRYREWGWEMFKAFMKHTAVEDGGGFTSLSNANQVPPVRRDNMESFWLAETLKYFYLLFSPDDFLPLDKVVINTEAHPLPRFDMGPLFSTGWKRKPRDADGNIIEEKEEAASDSASG
ncbi:family 47 glycoside hydrolase [Cryphonectria parasitica EP155]|uniref:alpha-1,2-Mannosidase n=1 Tax=Cryphonectria parasitica (strain ATCC 38755 / EP155) TaxID=660469 RepID=A0A9P4Y1T6_CRYP1|nr:family 47 glycoside hydrolase [Cryphonectria parasitica EP155]KAF3764939.1 family 47 glycoside hydrolase [Cryphonectria parasitica EP155]